MDIEQLTAFDRVVREGSFSRAARELHLAQPTISARIQTLEQAVGGPLLVRSNQGVKLTALGVGFLPYARRALAALLEGVAAAQEAQRGLRGRIKIGVLGSLAENLLAPALIKFQASHPTVECYARSADHLPMVELLYDGVVELAIIAWPCIQPLATDLKPLLHFHEPAPFVVPHRHPFTTQSGVTQAEISQSETRFLLLRWWQITPPEVARLAAHARFTADVPREIAVYLLREGHGMGFFPRAYIVRELQEGALVQIPVVDLPPLYRDSALVRLERNTELSPAATALIRCVREQAAQLGLLATT
ncbi:MAG: LysR family transcriptional regulator [Chloroflexi bacterium]|nr:LysR family transcriptional regulator [Chloroflexota bacterium]